MKKKAKLKFSGVIFPEKLTVKHSTRRNSQKTYEYYQVEDSSGLTMIFSDFDEFERLGGLIGEEVKVEGEIDLSRFGMFLRLKKTNSTERIGEKEEWNKKLIEAYNTTRRKDHGIL